MPEAEPPLLASINTTPLVDVMLVLLIIFLITIPVVNSSIAVQLPREPDRAQAAAPQSVIVTVDARGVSYWFDQPVAPAALAARLAEAAARQPQPELHIRADARADYQAVGELVVAAQKAGLARVGFLTEPPR
ncbi:biopolymer transporter ExbD [Ramlibacter aquaticus]|uniref:Biopolymer transporter ExbD n=2 Tax=Comamonadaceae TaxID=80864 RepID=A0ABR9SK83_9BURK|nr:biopolymer transporter ExbD [Ramlibacter aquaticus]